MVKGEQTMTTNTTTDLNEFTLSDQAVGTVMMALQKPECCQSAFSEVITRRRTDSCSSRKHN